MSSEEDIQRIVPVRLSSDERDTKGRELAQAFDDYEVLEEQKKEAGKNFTKQMRDKRAVISQLSRVVKVGLEPRVVVCRWVEDFPHNVKRLVRQDNGEVVEQRPLSAEERQLRMDQLDG